MNDSVSINCSALAWLLWGLAAVCAAVELDATARPAVMIAAMLCVGGAATLHVRTFVADLAANNRSREIEAFELGRETVRPLR